MPLHISSRLPRLSAALQSQFRSSTGIQRWSLSASRYSGFLSLAQVPRRRRPSHNSECRLRSAGRKYVHDCSDHDFDHDPFELAGPTSERLAGTTTSALEARLIISAEAGDVEDVNNAIVELVHDRGVAPSTRLYHALILSNISPEMGSADAVRILLDHMMADGIGRDQDILEACFRVLSIHPDFMLRERLQRELVEGWIEKTPAMANYTIAGLIREQQYESALQEIDSTRRRGVTIEAWVNDMLCLALTAVNEHHSALEVLQDQLYWKDDSIPLDLWFRLLDNASRHLEYPTTKSIWTRRVQSTHGSGSLGWINPPDGVCVHVLNTAAVHGDVTLALEALRNIERHTGAFDLIHLEAVLQALLRAGDLEQAVDLFCAVPELDPDYNVLEFFRPAAAYLMAHPERIAVAYDRFQWSHDTRNLRIPPSGMGILIEACLSLLKSQLPNVDEIPSALAASLEIYGQIAVLDSSYQRGNVDDAVYIRGKPSIDVINALLKGCRAPFTKDTMMYLLQEMIDHQIMPNALTYDRLILACLFRLPEPRLIQKTLIEDIVTSPPEAASWNRLPEPDDSSNSGSDRPGRSSPAPNNESATSLTTEIHDDAHRYYVEMRSQKLEPRPGTYHAFVLALASSRDVRVWDVLGDYATDRRYNKHLHILARQAWGDGAERYEAKYWTPRPLSASTDTESTGEWRRQS